jgi:hypothetical protein
VKPGLLLTFVSPVRIGFVLAPLYMQTESLSTRKRGRIMDIFGMIEAARNLGPGLELVIFESSGDRRSHDRAAYFKRCLVADYRLASSDEIPVLLGVTVNVRNGKVVLRKAAK